MKTWIFAAWLFAIATILVPLGPRSSSASTEKIKRPRNQFVAGRVLVKFGPKVIREHAQQVIAALGARDANEIREIGVHILELPQHANESAFVEAFRARPEVEFAELDWTLSLTEISPNDPFFNDPNAWGLQKIKGPEAWSVSTGQSSVIIAILDTGVDGSHPDLTAKMVPGWNIVDNNADTTDVKGHGTMVAGTAAASSNNGIGVTAVAWNCAIMPVRIAGSDGYATVSDIASGLTWAGNHGARVANISFNANGYATISSAANYFQSKGGVVTVAAGNDGASVSLADDPSLLTVGATDSSDILFSWSNRGNNLDLVAPGHVVTTAPGSSYAGADGTSFAAPIVAGAAALLFSVNPGFTASQVQNILKQSCDDLGSSGWDSTYGYGRVNLLRALTTSPGGDIGDTTNPNIVITTPADGSTVPGLVSVSVSATDNVGVTKVELYVDGSLYSSSTKAPFTTKWNTRKASRGLHSLQSKAYDSAGNIGNSPIVGVYK